MLTARPMKLLGVIAAFVLACSAAFGQATSASFNGTYEFQMVNLQSYDAMLNMYGQEVGFCNGVEIPGYTCEKIHTFNLIAGNLEADGAGGISSGSYTMTVDPNSLKCGEQSLTNPCPVIVPSDHAYSTAASYEVGQTVDFPVGGVTRTFQAVRANVDKPPDWGATADAGNICSYWPQDNCYWVQIPLSLTSGSSNNQSGTLVGTYTIQADGSGTMEITPSNCNDCGTATMSLVISPTNGVGQSISLAGINLLGKTNNMVGSGVRVK